MSLVYIYNFVLTAVSVVSGLGLSVSPQTDFDNTLKVISPSNDDYVAEEGESIYIKCVSENHFSRNSSLIWNINTKVRRHIKIMDQSSSENCFVCSLRQIKLNLEKLIYVVELVNVE